MRLKVFAHLNAAAANDVISISPFIEKPCLPKHECDDSDGIQQPMSGMLCDYQQLDSSLW